MYCTDMRSTEEYSSNRAQKLTDDAVAKSYLEEQREVYCSIRELVELKEALKYTFKYYLIVIANETVDV